MIEPRDEFEKMIIELFEDNFESLRIESGHAITTSAKVQALEQVIFYWRKLNQLAKKVTDTEVKLMLPGQITTKGRKFTIEGIVDIVNEAGEVWLYDIKTHDPDYITENRELYEQQLNVYSYIWQGLHKQQLNHTGIISTALPLVLLRALESGMTQAIEAEMEKWQPVIELQFSQEKVEETLKQFGEVVEAIEEGHFEPPLSGKLEDLGITKKRSFARRVCENCDARFSCNSYRQYAVKRGGRDKTGMTKFYSIATNPSSEDNETWITSNLKT